MNHRIDPDLNWCRVLLHHAERAPDRPLCTFEGQTVTYDEMWSRSRRLGAGLAELGVGSGDVVALLSYNRPEFLEAIFAANDVGAAIMPINWRLAAPEIAYILEHSMARVILCDGQLIELADQSLQDLPDISRVVVDGLDVEGWISLDEVRSDRVPASPSIAMGGEALHRLMYTSGTTGRPKGVMISHANLHWKNLAHVVEFGFTSSDLGLACGPLYHVGALDLTTTTLISMGASTIVHRTFDARDVVDEIEKSRVTVIWLAPAMVNAIMRLDDIENRDLSSVKVIIAGGEKMPIPLIERIRRVFPSAWFADAYGLTETVSGDTFLDRESTVRKLGSVGRPCAFLDLEIWDEDDSPVKPGESGEVVLRGPKVFSGYWRDESATSDAFRGGWFHTGDVGTIDQDGYVFIVDRKKDMILSGGENIASSEVERVLYEHQDVMEAAVIGRPDERWGEVPVAYVVLRAGSSVSADELIDYCRGQLARFKTPKAVHFIDALPRNPSGKILKRELRDQG